MPDPTDLHPAALRLIDARRRGVPAAAAAVPDARAAYAVQDQVGRALGWFGQGAPRAWKSGGASRAAVQTHAPLPPDGVLGSPADLRERPMHLCRVEAEIALRLARDVDAGTAAALDPAGAAAVVDAMCVSIEIVDSRWAEGLAATDLAKLADLQSHGALVLGAWMPFAPRDWSSQACVVTIGGRPPLERRGTHTMADPAWVLHGWLRHATARHGTLRAGTVVTTGSWVGMLEASRGDTVDVSFPGIGSARARL
jgi:2-keto-4-pentenoate hydratase